MLRFERFAFGLLVTPKNVLIISPASDVVDTTTVSMFVVVCCGDFFVVVVLLLSIFR